MTWEKKIIFIQCLHFLKVQNTSTKPYNKQRFYVYTLPSVSYLVGDFADTTGGFFRQTFYWFFRWLLRLPLIAFISYYFIHVFLLVSEYRQAKLATKRHDCAVFCWDCDHVSGLNYLSANHKGREKWLLLVI